MNTTKEKFKLRNAIFEQAEKTDEELEMKMEEQIKVISERIGIESRKLHPKTMREKIEAVKTVVQAALLIFEVKKLKD
jgi:hypothetical protein